MLALVGLRIQSLVGWANGFTFLSRNVEPLTLSLWAKILASLSCLVIELAICGVAFFLASQCSLIKKLILSTAHFAAEPVGVPGKAIGAGLTTIKIFIEDWSLRRTGLTLDGSCVPERFVRWAQTDRIVVLVNTRVGNIIEDLAGWAFNLFA